jgi:hypothetical protein
MNCRAAPDEFRTASDAPGESWRPKLSLESVSYLSCRLPKDIRKFPPSLAKQDQQGVDNFTVYAGILLRLISIADANDEAQFGELYVQLELTERAWKHGVQMTLVLCGSKTSGPAGPTRVPKLSRT